MNQEIAQFDNKKIFNIIENIIFKKFDNDIHIFFPKKKKWFEDYIVKLKEIYSNNKNLIKSLIDYKRTGYLMINNVLYHNAFPLMYIFNEYANKNLFLNNPVGIKPIYIFPNDIEKIKEFKKNEILNHIKNIDNIILNNNFELDDCLLFRGFHTINNKSNKDLMTGIDYTSQMTGFDYTTQFYNDLIFNKETDITMKNYNSFTFNPYIALQFIRENGYLLVLKIKKEDKVPGIFLTNSLFSNNPNFNNYSKNKYDEMEVLISRNLKIKIIKKKEIKSALDVRKSINDIYKNNSNKISNNLYRKIKIIYAETLPFERPLDFNPDRNRFQYMCV